MSIVIDASSTLPWYFQDESTPATEALMNRVLAQGAVVPAHWRLEIANGLRTGIRRGRIDRAYQDASLSDLEELPIRIDAETNQHAWKATVALADRYELTVYDAAYLELAQRARLPLATLDKDLGKAARESGVETLLS